jgi:hypothetical protein
MTDKVQRIRQEIEKRLKCLEEIKLRRELAAAEIGDIACCKYLLSFIDFLQKEPETKFKIGDRIRLKGTTVKGDTIIRIYTSEVGNAYFEFKNSSDASADLDWELVEEPKKCMYTKDDFTEEDRKILCEDCEEKCEYAKKEEPVSNNYSALLPCIYNRALEERVKYCKYCSAACEGRVKEPVSEELEEAAVEAFKQIVDENRNSFLEIFKAGAQWMHKKMIHEFNLKEE